MYSQDKDFIPIYERFADGYELRDAICEYYPAQAHDYNLHKSFQRIGRGAEAYAFQHLHRPDRGTTVTKFTQSRAHAKVSNYLAQHKIQLPHIVNTHEVAHLPELGLYMISEELLLKPQGFNKDALGEYFRGETAPGSWIDLQITGIIQDLNTLGVREWREDCVADHNIMIAAKSGKLKAFDFGFTKTDFPEDFHVWP